MTNSDSSMNAKEALKTYFGYDSFREGQESIIESILTGRDGLAIMPTGAGKSICYQVPALILPGITLVISPLISLMQDQVKAFLPKRPIVSASTATATEEVKEDILCILNLVNPFVTVTGFDRENLYYRVEAARKKDDFVIDYIEKHPAESGIIYCATRKNVDNLSEILSKRGVPVTKYHAGLDNETRKKNQDDFIYDRAPVIVATNAFGMGIDKSNVRYVIHYNMPQSMENYYQEAGRAGRDGEPAQCILLFSAQDIMINKFLLEKKDFSGLDYEDIELVKQRDIRRLQIMEGYCRTTLCLRNYILDYFGEKATAPCDNCGNCHREYKEMDMTAEAKQIINCVAETRGRYGLTIVLGTLMGADRARLRELGTVNYKSYGALKDQNEALLRSLISQMIEEGYLYQTEDRYSVLKMGNITPLRAENTRVKMRIYEEKEPDRRKPSSQKRSTDALTSAGYDLFEELRGLRLAIAREESLPPYIIFNDKTLIDMCVRLPRTAEDLLQVSGVGQNKLEKYGDRFLGAIASFVAAHPDAVISMQDTAGSAPNTEKKVFNRADFNRQRNRPDGAGAPWNEEENARLDQEYQSGMRISEIARLHSRTAGGIRARLKKHGLIEE